MAWPSLQDYNEAVQNPRLNLLDPELHRATVEINKLGIPIARSGAFASVYKLEANRRQWAVKFFQTESKDRQERYDAVARYLDANRLPYMVEFQFEPIGVRIRGATYPLLKMEWIQGQTLDAYIQQNLRNTVALKELAKNWLKMVHDLQEVGAAHGDLQHGNVLVVNGTLKLIDYDDMYVPGLAGRRSPEIGNRNYQHPRRDESNFGPYVDNFSAWIIYLSLLILSEEPSLWAQSGAGGERLLFSSDDFAEPDRSQLLRRLEASNNDLLSGIPSVIRGFLLDEIADIPALQDLDSYEKSATGGVDSSSPGRWWETAKGPASDSEATTSGAEWIHEHLAPVPEARFLGSPSRIRALLVSQYAIIATAGALFCFAVVSLTTVLVTLSAGLLLALVALTVGFHVDPSVREKRRISGELQDSRKLAYVAQRKIAGLDKQTKNIERDERNELETCEGVRKGLVTKERDALAALDSDCLKRIAEINAKRNSIKQSRSKELSESLRLLQEKWLSDGLSRHRLTAGKVSGIGIELTSRLEANGVKTAADLVSYSFSPSVYGVSAETVLYLANGGVVSVPGIGEKKAVALLLWRQTLLSEIKRRQPTSLPPSIEAAINSKCDSATKSLDSDESAARRNVQVQKEALRKPYVEERERWAARVRDIHQKFDLVRSENESKLRSAQEELRTAVFGVGSLERRLRAYAKLSAMRYIGFLLGIAQK